MKNKVILPLIMLNMIGGIASGFMIWWSGGNPMWIGSMMAMLPLPFFLIIMTNAFGITRTTTRLPLVQLISLAGLALTVYTLFSTVQGPETISQYAALILSIIGAVFVQWYVWSYSNYGRKKSSAIVKGRPLPDLPFWRLNGEEIRSSSFGGSKTLLVFFRANWCPFCMGQLKEVLAKAEQLKADGVQVKFISNQSVKHSEELAEKLNLPSHYEILQDNNLRAARVLGIEDLGGTPAGMSAFPKDTVMATVIALDDKGNVLFGDETDNYRVRPHPDTFIHVFENPGLSGPGHLKAVAG